MALVRHELALEVVRRMAGREHPHRRRRGPAHRIPEERLGARRPTAGSAAARRAGTARGTISDVSACQPQSRWLPARPTSTVQHRVRAAARPARPRRRGASRPARGSPARRARARRRCAPASAAGRDRPRTPARRRGPRSDTGPGRRSPPSPRRARPGAAPGKGRPARSAGRPMPPSRRADGVDALGRPARQHRHPLGRQRRERRRQVVGGHRNSLASASPGSAARMNASPTRKACTPASRMRAHVVRRRGCRFR